MRYALLAAGMFALFTTALGTFHLLEITPFTFARALPLRALTALAVGVMVARARKPNDATATYFVAVTLTTLTTLFVELGALEDKMSGWSEEARRMLSISSRYESNVLDALLWALPSTVVSLIAVRAVWKVLGPSAEGHSATAPQREAFWVGRAQQMLNARTSMGLAAAAGVVLGFVVRHHLTFDSGTRHEVLFLDQVYFLVWTALTVLAWLATAALARALASERRARHEALRVAWEAPAARIRVAPNNGGVLELRVPAGYHALGYREDGERVVAHEHAEWLEDAGIDTTR